MSKTLRVPSPAAPSRVSPLVHLIPSAALGGGFVLTCACAMGLSRNLHAPALFFGVIAGVTVGRYAAGAWNSRR